MQIKNQNKEEKRAWVPKMINFKIESFFSTHYRQIIVSFFLLNPLFPLTTSILMVSQLMIMFNHLYAIIDIC